MKKSALFILALLVCVALAPMVAAFNPQPEPPGKSGHKYVSPYAKRGFDPQPEPPGRSYTPMGKLVVRSQKPAPTTQPGIGKYLAAYYGSDEPASPRYYLGSGNIVKLQQIEAERYAARRARASIGERAYQQAIAQREARRHAKPGYRVYQWGVSAPMPMRVRGGLQPVPTDTQPAEEGVGMTFIGTPNVY